MAPPRVNRMVGLSGSIFRLMLQFCGSVVTSGAGLLAHRELDDVLGLSALARDVLASMWMPPTPFALGPEIDGADFDLRGRGLGETDGFARHAA
jgi:hypothetical protein